MRRYLFLGGMVAALMAPVGFLAGGAIWPGYDHATQTVSELVARDAPHRFTMAAFFAIYNGLLLGFGLALYDLAREWERTRGLPARDGLLSGGHVVALAVLGLALLALPMDPVGGGRTPIGLAHTIVASLMALLAGLATGLGGRWLRHAPGLESYNRFSLAATAAIALFGALTFLAFQLDVWPGLMERLIIGAYEVWMFVLARKFYQLTAVSGLWAVSSKQ
jgi:hypothetical protein